ncbi:MAG: hypothetical protein U1E65_02050 [Myxococcota bacterium]
MNFEPFVKRPHFQAQVHSHGKPRTIDNSRRPQAAAIARLKAAPRPDSGPLGLATEIFALEGKLNPEQVKTAERVMGLISDAQIEHLATTSDLADKSPRFKSLVAAKKEIDGYFKTYDSLPTNEHVRQAIPELIANNTLTPPMTAKLLSVLLTGVFTRHYALNIDWKKPFSFSDLLNPQSNLHKTDLDSLHDLLGGLQKLPVKDREKVLRATTYELSKIDSYLPQRMVEEIGTDTLRKIVPSLPSTVEAQAAELSRQDKVGDYLRLQRVGGQLKVYTPSPALKAEIARAAGKLNEADRFASINQIDVASEPAQLAKARALYADVASSMKEILAHNPMAIQDPVVKGWMSRRARALFVRSAVAEVESGAQPNAFMSAVRGFAQHIPFLKSAVKPSGFAERTLIDGLKATLGFDPTGALADGQRAKLVEATEARICAGDAGQDPLVRVMLDPDLGAQKKLSHVHVLFEPGVVPIDGVLGDSFADAEQRLGVKYHVAKTGFFASEEDNAVETRKAFDQILAQDPEAKIMVLGYSQGAVNGLYFIDQLRSGSPEDRKAAEHIKAMASIYGAHNGSTAAEDGLKMVEGFLHHLPWGSKVEHLLANNKNLGTWIAGGVDSLKRSTRHLFWDRANLPSDIPYVSITARSRPDEVPGVLDYGYKRMKEVATGVGLLPDNDTQVLTQDAPLGNQDTAMGRAVRKNMVNLEVHGHHWNPLRAKHMKFDPEPQKYAFPKAPQIEMQVSMLGELGLL